MRCAYGIWPPSKPRRKPSLLAFWPFWPRPDVLPRPEPVPRPMRCVLWREPLGGLRSCSCIALLAPLMLLVRAGAPDLVLAALGADVRLAFDGDQEVHRLQHATDGVVVWQFARLVHPPKTQRLNRRPDLRQGADRALHERRLQGLALRLLRGCSRHHFVSAGVAAPTATAVLSSRR